MWILDMSKKTWARARVSRWGPDRGAESARMEAFEADSSVLLDAMSGFVERFLTRRCLTWSTSDESSLLVGLDSMFPLKGSKFCFEEGSLRILTRSASSLINHNVRCYI